MLMNDQAEKLFAIASRDPGPATVATSERGALRDNDTKFTTFISAFTIDPAPSLRARMNLTDPRTGVDVPMEVVSGKILNERGESLAIVSVLHDLTQQTENERLYEELKRLNSELEGRVAAATADLAAQNARLQWQSMEVEKANKLKSDFLASMSHELRTPINALIGYTALMLDGVYGDMTSSQVEAVRRAHDAGRHLAELIGDILDLARIEAGKTRIQVAPIMIGEVLAETTTQIEPLAAKKGLRLECRVEPGLPAIQSDRMKLKQILLNLLSNAVKFTSSGSVVLAAARSGDGVRCDVADTGIGIASEDLGKIWEDFRQLDGSHTREFGGTGLRAEHHAAAGQPARGARVGPERVRPRVDVSVVLPACAPPESDGELAAHVAATNGGQLADSPVR